MQGARPAAKRDPSFFCWIAKKQAALKFCGLVPKGKRVYMKGQYDTKSSRGCLGPPPTPTLQRDSMRDSTAHHHRQVGYGVKRDTERKPTIWASPPPRENRNTHPGFNQSESFNLASSTSVGEVWCLEGTGSSAGEVLSDAISPCNQGNKPPLQNN